MFSALRRRRATRASVSDNDDDDDDDDDALVVLDSSELRGRVFMGRDKTYNQPVYARVAGPKSRLTWCRARPIDDRYTIKKVSPEEVELDQKVRDEILTMDMRIGGAYETPVKEQLVELKEYVEDKLAQAASLQD